MAKKLLTDEERFKRHFVVAQSGCWEWTASKWHGYGRFSVGSRRGMDRKTVRAHRFSYEARYGQIGPRLTIDHLCKNPGCVNPDHMQAVPQVENLRRGNGFVGANYRKTHCPNGHLFSADNTYLYRGSRHCKACRYERQHTKYFERKSLRIAEPKLGRPQMTVCKNGHPFVGFNIFIQANGKRRCLQCLKAKRRA